MSNTSEWDDLFALAAGETTAAEVVTNAGSVVESTEEREGKPKARSHTQQTLSSSSSRKKAKPTPTNAHNRFLSERNLNYVTQQLPSGFVYGSSLRTGGNPCAQATFTTERKTKKHCKRYRGSRFRHKLLASSTSDSILTFFCCLRNLRHICFISIKDTKTTASVIMEELACLRKDLRKIRQEGKLSSILHQNMKLTEKLRLLMNQLVKCCKLDSIRLEHAVQLMIDTDAVYYELYYVEITTGCASSGSSQQHFVPHPNFYFGESLEELHEADRYYREISQVDDTALRHSLTTFEAIIHEDPLTIMHHVRFLETIQVFHLSGWLSDKERYDDFVRVVHQSIGSSSLYDIHETPAPPLLASWRDSCRDFLTHLYAYATIPNSIRDGIQDFVEQDRVVEIGAGSGYLASLLTRQSVIIDAFDSRPGKLNDYHGSTPTFLPIQTGDGGKVITQQHQPFVLLLCYPPPDTSMAVETLQQFVKRGGNRLVHAGEFKGLTGNGAFERMLTLEFICTKRFTCPTWGTDSAYVTFWEKKEKSDNRCSILLPCVICGKESQQRFRLVRYLCYCSAPCWKEHASKSLRTHLKLSTVEIGSSLPEYGDKAWFLSLVGKERN